MPAIVIDAVNKPKPNPDVLIEYSREIIPKIKDLMYKKELLADFKASDAKAIELMEAIKEAQAEFKTYVEESEDGMMYIEEIKAVENEIKEAVKAAGSASHYKPADLKKFMVARAKDTVSKTVQTGEFFAELDKALS